MSAPLFHTPIHPPTEKERVILGKKHNDHGTGIPRREVEALARLLLPDIRAFYESEEGKREFAEWKAKQEAKNKRNNELIYMRTGRHQEVPPSLFCFP